MSEQQAHGGRSGTRALSGGGEATYTVEHRDEDRARRLASKIETAIEMVNAQYFNETPRARLGTRRTTSSGFRLSAIQEAVDEANRKPSFAKNHDGRMEYVVTEGYYPDEYDHYVDVTDVEPAGLFSAFLGIQSELCRRGYMVNSIRTDDDGRLTKLHVMPLTWAYEYRSSGRRDEQADDDSEDSA